MTPEERIERLERALLEFVYYEKDSNEVPGWRTEFYVDVYVNDIIGDLLDKYKPAKDIADP